MIPVPPKLLRRVAVAPLVAAFEVLLILASPALLVVACMASPAFGGSRPLRMTLIVIAFAMLHVGATLACLGLWVASGFGRRTGTDSMLRAHYAVMGWFVAGVYRTIVKLARVEVSVSESDVAEQVRSTRDRPVLVLSRHAGEGDTLLVIHELLCRHNRGPRVVVHEALRLDPLIDVLGYRLPNRFVDPRGGDTELDIAVMAEELGETAALVIFPEGGNFSPERRLRGIERLDRAGHFEEAGWAREMKHLSAPRPGGALAAIEAAPSAEVVVLGHFGFRQDCVRSGSCCRNPKRSRCGFGMCRGARYRPTAMSGSTGCSGAGGRSTRGWKSACEEIRRRGVHHPIRLD